MRLPGLRSAAVLIPFVLLGSALPAQTESAADALAVGSRLDVLGATADAKVIFQRLINTAASPAAKAEAQRAMAMSYAFDGDCANTVKYEELVIAYWATREPLEPQNAFYQQGEMANEAARVCLDQGQLDVAEALYRRGAALGNAEPAPRTHPASLWDYRTAHALGRIAARRGDAAGAQRHISEARRVLDSDPTMAAAQERFFPYLTGYVALYTDDLRTAQTELVRALRMPGNTSDPYLHALLGMTYEKLGMAEKATELYTTAYGLATAHNPPSAFTRPFTRKKLGQIALEGRGRSSTSRTLRISPAGVYGFVRNTTSARLMPRRRIVGAHSPAGVFASALPSDLGQESWNEVGGAPVNRGSSPFRQEAPWLRYWL